MQSIQKEEFWNYFMVIDSPCDGHCSVHSFVKSFNSQHASIENINIENLLKFVQVEIESNTDLYTLYLRWNSSSNLLTEINLYVYHKVYDTSFGDVVPVVISRVTDVNLINVGNGQSSRENCIIVQVVHITTALWSILNIMLN